MYGKYKKRASRVGFHKIKLICSINVTQLIIANSSPIDPGSILSVCFEKGGKISTSNEIIFDINKNDINPLRSNANLKYVTIPIDERVELVMTLYKDLSTNRYQEKLAKLILRQLKRHSGLGMDAFKGIGVCVLRLHDIVEDLAENSIGTKEYTLQLDQLPGCSMTALINIKFLKTKSSMFGIRKSLGGISSGGNLGEGDSAEDDDDAVSVGSTVSGGSAFSTLGATFYYNDLEEYSGAGESIVGTTGAVTSGHSDSYTFGKKRSSFDGDPDSESTNMTSVGGVQRRRSGLHMVEVARQTERKPIKPLSRRSSNIGLPSSRSAQALQDSDINPSDSFQSGLQEATYSAPSSPTPEPDPVFFSPPRNESAPDHTHRTPSAHIPVRHGDENETGVVDWMEDTDTAGAEWASVTSTERERTSMQGSSPIKLTPKTLNRKTSLSPPNSRRQSHSCITNTNANLAEHCVYNNQETFALLEKELQARGERIAALEARLDHQEQDHRAELLTLRSELNAAQAEVRILSTVSPLPPVHESAPPPVSSAAEVEEVKYDHSVEIEVVPTAPFLCARCQGLVPPVTLSVPGRRESEDPAASFTQPPTADSELPEEPSECDPTAGLVRESEESAAAAADVSHGQHVDGQQTITGEVVDNVAEEKEEEQEAAQESGSGEAHSEGALLEEVEVEEEPAPPESEERDSLPEVFFSTHSHSALQSILLPPAASRSGVEPIAEMMDQEGEEGAPDEASVSTQDDNIAVSLEDTANIAEVAAITDTTPIKDAPEDPLLPQESSIVTSILEPTATPLAQEERTEEQESVKVAQLPPEEEEGRRPVSSSAIATLLSEYGRSSAQVQLLAQDLVYYKQLAEDALRAKADETQASREAATVAVQACMRRADCEQELEESIFQLRELQRKHAQLGVEYEAEVRRNYSLKARLQLYAQKLSAMEVDYTLSLEEA